MSSKHLQTADGSYQFSVFSFQLKKFAIIQLMAKPISKIKGSKFETEIQRFSDKEVSSLETDALAVEEPLEIRLGFSEKGKPVHKAISITMRTPGNDFELASGFLFTEGILHKKP